MDETRLRHPTEYIHEHFQKGGNIQEVLLVLVGIAIIFALLTVAHRLQRGGTQSATPNSPAKLFKSVVRELELTVRQRDILGKIALQTGMRHPTVILLGPTFFDRQVDRWWGMNSRLIGRTKSRTEQTIASLRMTLFDDAPKT